MLSLRSFLEELPDDEVLRISEPVQVDYHPTALVLALEKQRRFPVVYIENPVGFDVPIVSNIFADRNRIARIAGAKPGHFNEAWTRALENPTPPVMVSSGPIHERVFLGNEADAALLPISRHFQQDAGRYIGSGILVCKDPDTGARNLSFQRLQLKGPNRFGASPKGDPTAVFA